MLPASAFAWRCGNLIVRRGTKQPAVSLYCGKPLYREVKSAANELWIYGTAHGVYRILHMKNGAVMKVEIKPKR